MAELLGEAHPLAARRGSGDHSAKAGPVGGSTGRAALQQQEGGWVSAHCEGAPHAPHRPLPAGDLHQRFPSAAQPAAAACVPIDPLLCSSRPAPAGGLGGGPTSAGPRLPTRQKARPWQPGHCTCTDARAVAGSRTAAPGGPPTGRDFGRAGAGERMSARGRMLLWRVLCGRQISPPPMAMPQREAECGCESAGPGRTPRPVSISSSLSPSHR
jgi:hypothetical protein